MKEIYRQFSHMLFGLVIAAFIYLVPQNIALYTFIAVIFVGVLIADAIDRGLHVPLFSYIIGKLERDGVFPGQGTIFFFIGVLFCLAFFGSAITITGIVILSVLDSVSTIAGINFGKRKIFGEKTLEGAVCGIAAAFVVLLIFTGPVNALILAVVAGITELLSPVDDNLTIPVISCICLMLLTGGITF